MAGESVQIDLDEVQSAARTIAGLLDELNGPVNQLEAKVKQIQKSVYGSDLLGKALGGESSSVGGLDEHQEQVLAGIKSFLQNASAVAANLQTMAARHRTVDEQHAADLRRLGSDSGDPSGTPPAPAPAPAPAPVPGPAPAPVGPSAPAPVTAPGIGYHDPTAPDLDYNKPTPAPEGRPGGGGGGQRNLI